MPKGLFIVLEGCEGSGKSTQAKRLHQRVLESQPRAVLVHEPGTTPLGNYLRNYLKSKQPLSREAELLLFEAARAQLVSDQINPNLAAGRVVIADRFTGSSIAYQGHGRRLDVGLVHSLNDFATGRLAPQITFLLDIDPAEGLKRVGEPQLRLPLEPDATTGPARQDVAGQRRFEDQDLAFHSRVRRGYLDLAAGLPDEWQVVNGNLSEEAIARLIWEQVEPLLPGSSPGGPDESHGESDTKDQPLLLQ